MRDWVRELNRLLAAHPALADDPNAPANFEWIDCADTENCVLVWVRRTVRPEDTLVVAANFTPRPHDHYRIGLPDPGAWNLVANSDSNRWGGSGYAIPQQFGARDESVGQWQWSADIGLPPLGLVVFGRDL